MLFCFTDHENSTDESGPSAATPPDTIEETCQPECKLVSLTVILNATQKHVRGDKNWATVKKGEDDVIIEATTEPNTEECWNRVNWSGEAVTGVPGKPNQRKLSRATSRECHVEAELGGVSDYVDVWVLWADLVVTVGASDTLDEGNDAKFVRGHVWPEQMGGGDKLGPISSEDTSLTYAYTVGKMQAKATLTPPGIEDVIYRSYWRMKRTVDFDAWDNGVSSQTERGRVDDSNLYTLDEDPTSGDSIREIYDVDAPGCSMTKVGTEIDHTAEVYDNFTQFVTVILDEEIQCSDNKLWSYVAQIDVDKECDKVEKNELKLSHVTLPDESKYDTRD